MLQVTINRDAMTAIPTDIREHELPILQELYDDDRVTVVKSFTMQVPEASVDEEYARLEAKYKLSRTAAVRQVYPTRKALADAMGVAYKPQRGSQRQAPMPGSLVITNPDPRMSNVSGGDDVSALEAELAKAQKEAEAKLASLKQQIEDAKLDEKLAPKPAAAAETGVDAARATPVVIVSKAEVKAAKTPKAVSAPKAAKAKKGK
jgi:hypothetical protein